MAQIPKETIEKVLESTDIVDLVQSYIPLKRMGAAFKANCPFHHEKTPSFTVSPSRQTFHCFGCGKHGSAIGFVMEYESLPFADAVKKLAAKANIPIIETFDPQADADRRSKGRLLDLHREAAAFFHEQLLRNPEAQHARDYMRSRGFGKEMAARWMVGWMPRDSRVFKEWVKSRKFTGQELVASGMAGLKEEGNPRAGLYIRFTDRLMFPICNEIGDVIAFSGRKLREDQQGGKYQNSPETVIFKKSNVLFALDRAKKPILKEKFALLCEGQLDAICCHEAGIEQAIGTQGTALTTQHAKILKRYVSQVILCYDADSAGIAASEKAFKLIVEEGMTARVVEMPPGDDPDSFLKAHGVEAFRTLISEAKDFFDSKLDLAKQNGLLEISTERTRITNECVDALAAMSDHAARDHQINVVATHLGISAASIREGIARMKRWRKRDDRTNTEEQEAVVEPTPIHSIVNELCHLALSSSEAQHFLAEQFESLHEADRWVEGIPLLERILGAAPDPSSSTAVNAFMLGLPEADRLALSNEAARWVAGNANGLQSAEQSLALLSSDVIQKRAAAVKYAMNEPGLSPQRLTELLNEAKEISALMRGSQRFEFDDQLAPSTYRPKPPPWKKKWEK